MSKNNWRSVFGALILIALAVALIVLVSWFVGKKGGGSKLPTTDAELRAEAAALTHPKPYTREEIDKFLK